MGISDNELPASALAGVAFASSLAEAYSLRGNGGKDLFVALAGLVCVRYPQVGAECLKALDDALESRAANAKRRGLAP